MKVLIVGDFFPDTKLSKKLLENAQSNIFGDFFKVIEQSDLAIVNLEAPLTFTSKAIQKTGPALKADRVFAKFLKGAGFGLATLANNHIMDFGSVGLSDTLEALNEVGLGYVGVGNSALEANKPYLFNSQNGRRLAVLNFAENEWSTTSGNYPGAAGINPINNFYAIQEAKKSSDIVLVITHGGHEHYCLPSKAFKSLLRFYIDSGADAVINHHTHHVSGYESYAGKPIYYSLGNFLFSNNANIENYWNKGLAVEIDFSKPQPQTTNYFFRQGLTDKTFDLLRGNYESLEIESIDKLNEIIQDNILLESKFNDWMTKSNLYYTINIEPHSNKILQAMQNRKLLPSLWSNRKKRYLLNMLKCESHREMLIKQIENEISNS
jgi:hypothetical protein